MLKDDTCTSVQVSPDSSGFNNTTMLIVGIKLMPKKIFVYCLFFYCLFTNNCFGQDVEVVTKPTIQGIRLYNYGDQLSVPIYALNSGSQIELHFDDLDADVKSYYYTLQLCDYNWNKVNLSPFMYLKGFTQQRIATYRYSSLALTKYTHYQTTLPDRNMQPILSGNYLVKVFLDGDTNKLIFTKRLLVADNKAIIKPQVVQPYASSTFRIHQKLIYTATVKDLNAFNAAQQVKVVILQNGRWDNAQKNIAPTFVRGNNLEFNTENVSTFAAGKEWRWLDLRSFRLQSDRVDSAKYNKTNTNIYVKPDIDRTNQRYVYYRDYNGFYTIESYENINPYWQGDYAAVRFTFATPNAEEIANKDIYLIGQLTNYALNEKTKMIFNKEKGVYENTQFLKQGYYSYAYLMVDKASLNNKKELEGDYWETENNYTILFYYKAFTDRCDQLIGVSQITSRLDRPGISF